MGLEKKIFKTSSVTFFSASLIFPKIIQKDVSDLYSFLRVADDYVDEKPVKSERLEDLAKMWSLAKDIKNFEIAHTKNDSTNQRITKNIIRLSRKYNFEPEWIDKFLSTMKSDLDFESKQTLEDSLEYTNGSAEVVGLMMSRIMGLPRELDGQAQLLGRAFQWMNFIRDIEEDNKLGRCYFPKDDLKRFGLIDLSEETSGKNPELFRKFIDFQIDRYESWCAEASSAFSKIPWRKRLALQVAVDLFDWTIEQIKNNPQAVYEKKIKPSKARITIFVFKRCLRGVRS